MKLGFEVEGRKQGTKTLFADSHELFNPYDSQVTLDGLNKISTLQIAHGFSHVYISDPYSKITLSADNPILKQLHDMNLSITVERRVVYKYEMKKIPHWVDLFLCIVDKSFWQLRPTDQIKFSKELTVFSEMKGNMVLTQPQDFEKDVRV